MKSVLKKNIRLLAIFAFLSFGLVAYAQTPPEGLQTLVDSANKLLVERKFEACQKTIEKIVAQYPNEGLSSYLQYLLRGKLSTEIKGYPNAQDWLNKAEIEAYRLKRPDLTLRVLKAKGTLFQKTGAHILSLHVFQEGKKIAESIGDESSLATFENSIGGVYYSAGQYREALYYFLKGLEMFEKLSKKENSLIYWVQNGLDNVALCYDRLRDPINAEKYYLKAIRESYETNNIIGASVAQVNFGKMLTGMGKLERALPLLESSVKNAQIADYQHYDHASQANFEMANILIKLGRPAEAETYLSNGFELMQRRDLEFWHVYFRLRSEMYEQQGDFKRSNGLMTEFLSLYDSLKKKDDFNEYTREALNLELQEKEIENNLKIKNLEIETLRQRNYIFYAILFGFLIVILLSATLYYRRSTITLSNLNEAVRSQQDKLKETNSLLQKADRQKDMVLTTVAHDLRSLVGGLLVGSRNLKRIWNSKELQKTTDIGELLQLMDRTSSHALQIVDDLVAIKELEDQSITLRIKEVSLKKIISHAWDSLQYISQPKRISLSVEVAAETLVMVDEIQFERVIENLLSNAIKFSRPGATVTIQDKRLTDSHEIQVSDVGIGIKEESLPYIFTPFFKGSTGTGGEKSTGLGLSIVKQILQNHGAEITVHSTENVGTVFTISLKLNLTEN